MRHSLVPILLITALLLVPGCGGGGGASNPPTPTVSGVAAAGAAIVGTVSLKDSAATPRELSKATSDGSFSFDVTGLTGPFILRATGTAHGVPYTLYSLAEAQGTANINPLSSLVLARASAGADLATVYGAPAAPSLPAISAAMAQALLDVQSTLKPLLQKYGVAAADPIQGAYKADGTGLDRMFDLVQIELGSPGSVTITDTGASPVTSNVVTDFATYAVSGTVTFDGAPFAGVTVSVADAATGTVIYGSSRSAADGSYVVNSVARGSVTVTPTLPGYSFDRTNTTLTVATADCQVPVFQSFQPYTVSGTVASANGSGLAGVTVSAQRNGPSSIVSAVTNGSGRYSLSGLPYGSYTVTPSRVYDPGAVGFDGAQVVTISAAGNFARANFTASLASFTVSGNVARLTGGEAMANVAISLLTKNGSGTLLTDSEAIFNTVTDAAGNYSLGGIPNGYYALIPSLAGYGFALLDVIATSGMSADNFSVNGANLILNFSGRPASDANGGVTGL